jgi:hypothetical protein
VLDVVLDALEENSSCEALYIQVSLIQNIRRRQFILEIKQTHDFFLSY